MGFFDLRTQARLAQSILTKNQPIYVQYYITARCNLACEQCNVIYANADVAEASITDVGKIAENLARIGTSVVLLTGGEPFARRDLPQIVEAFVKQGIHVRMQTNGLASKAALEACVRAGANDISISLDSLQPDLQETINGAVPESWTRAIRTISYVNELFPGDAFAAFGCVIAPRNLEHVPDVVRFATEIGWWVSLVPAHTTSHRSPMSFRTYDTQLKFRADLYPRVHAILDQVHEMRNSGYNLYDSDPYLDDIRRMITGQRVTWRDRNEGVCDSPNLYFAVIPNGDMAVCCDWRMKSKISLISPDFPERYREARTFVEARTIAAACQGCLFGSFPEISISTRYLGTMIKRTLLFGLQSPARKLKKVTEQELIEIAAAIRAKSPSTYSSETSEQHGEVASR